MRPVSGETYYLPEDFETLSEKSLEIINEIKGKKEHTGTESGYHYFIYESTKSGKNGEQFLSRVHMQIDKSQSLYAVV